MPIASSPTNILSSAQIAPDSVETTDIKNNAVTLAKMAGGTDGNIIVFDANGDPVALAVGTSGQFLETKGAGAPPEWGTAAADWVQLGETILGANAATVEVAGFAARKDLLILFDMVGKDGTGYEIMRFNSDSGNDYGYKGFRDATAGGLAAQNGISLNVTRELDTTNGCYYVIHVQNSVTGRQKAGTIKGTEFSGVAASVLATIDSSFLYEEAVAQITTVTFSLSANQYLSGSRVTVYGKKD